MIAVLALLLVALLGCGQDGRQFVRVEQGAFRTQLVETGELQAVRYAVIPMPRFRWSYGRPKITELAPEGTRVKKGEVVGQIETSGVSQELGQDQTDLSVEQANLAQMVVQQTDAVNTLEASIQTAESALQQAQVNQKRAQFESDAERKIQTLQLQSAQLSLNKLNIQLAALKETQREDLRIQNAKIRKIEAEIAQADTTISRFTLRAPAPGLVQYQLNHRTREKVAVGDQLWFGSPIIGLPDLSRMKVATTVNETDIDKIKIGQQAQVRLDAFPQYVFGGQITEISRVCRKKDKDDNIKVFDVEVLLDESNPLLRPGMTVQCDFVVANLAHALFVRADGVHYEGHGYVVYVKQVWGVKRVPVTLGPRNAQDVVISGNVRAGAEVALEGGAT